MKIRVRGRTQAARVIQEVLSPWSLQFNNGGESEIEILYEKEPSESTDGRVKTIVIPSDSENFVNWTKAVKLGVKERAGEPVSVCAASGTVLTIRPERLFSFDGIAESASMGMASARVFLDEDLIVLTFDLVKEYLRILDETLNAKSSKTYRLLTGAPVPYGLAPQRLRDMLMKSHSARRSQNYRDCVGFDAIRFLLKSAIEELSDERIERKTWSGRQYACVLTHDLDTREGLRRASAIKSLEDKYDVPSAWYIPSKNYDLDGCIVKNLGNHGEIGAHDTKHDGRLVNLSQQKLAIRLREAKDCLERITNQSIQGFRSPLLQHSPDILHGLKEAGYKYDSSIPTWEPRHPRTMCSHGLGTVFPILFDGIVEIPVTNVQDHQLLYVSGMKPRDVLTEWLSEMALIEALGGCCVLLSHPEYKLFDAANFGVYEELLNEISCRPTWLTTPSQLADAFGKMGD